VFIEHNMGSTAEPHIVTLPPLSCADASELPVHELHNIVEEWVHNFNKVLNTANFTKLQPMIHQDAWMRDLLTMSWNFRTLNGQDKISSYFQQHLRPSGLGNLRLRNAGAFQPKLKKMPNIEWVEAMFDFETSVGLGSGILRLVHHEARWKLFMISFMLQKLKSFDETTHLNRPHGGGNSINGAGNWQERRERQKEFLDNDPAVVVVGAGMYLSSIV
jgi:hypothetical protein